MVFHGHKRTGPVVILLPLLLACIFSFSKAYSGPASEHRFYVQNASSFKMRGKIYVCGLREKTSLFAVVFCCDSNLVVLDSAEFLLGKQKAADFGITEIDSLHGALQIQLPFSNLKGITLLRLSCDLKHSELIKDLEPGRINSKGRFSADRLELEDGIVELSKQQDTAGLQYFLNLYKLKSNTGNYEYKQVWQFPVPKKNLVAAELMRVDDRFVYVALSYLEAGKTKVLLNKYNLSQGHLVSSYFIAESVDQYRVSLLQPISKGEWIVAGQVHSKTEVKLWHLRIDSLQVKTGAITTTLPMQAKSSVAANILVDISSVQENQITQKLILSANLYTVDAIDRACLFLPDLQLEVSNAKTPVRVVPAITFPTAIYDVYKSMDKAERSGKRGLVKAQPSGLFFQLAAEKEIFAAAVGSSTPAQAYVCSKTEAKKQKRVYFLISQSGAATQKKLLETVDLLQSPKALFYSRYRVVLCKQSGVDVYLTNLYNW